MTSYSWIGPGEGVEEGWLALLRGTAVILGYRPYPHRTLFVGVVTERGRPFVMRLEQCSRICAPVSWNIVLFEAIVRRDPGGVDVDDDMTVLVDRAAGVRLECYAAVLLTYDEMIRFVDECGDDALRGQFALLSDWSNS